MMDLLTVSFGDVPVQRLVLRRHGKWWRRQNFSGGMMAANADFKDLFSIFNEEKVEYLVVGAHAVIFFAEPRYTKDLDLWVNATPENAARVYRALVRFGAPLLNVSEDDFCKEDMIYQIGVEPNRIDIIMGISGVSFSDAWLHRVKSSYAGASINIMGKDNLISSKEAAGRPQDLLDLEKLRV